MPKRYFLTYTALGSGIFCFGLAYLGDAAGHNVDAIVAYVHAFAGVIAVGFVAVVAIAIAVWRSRRSRTGSAPTRSTP